MIRFDSILVSFMTKSKIVSDSVSHLGKSLILKGLSILANIYNGLLKSPTSPISILESDLYVIVN